MSKIYITGIVAAGKTTLAKQLSEQLNIPHYELDCIIHHKTETERYKRTPEQQKEVIEDIDKKGTWIIEGTHRQSCHYLLDMADQIIFLDTSLKKRRLRILLRYIKQQLGIEKCHYNSDFNMLKNMYRWTNEFEMNRIEFVKMLKQYESKLRIVTNAEKLAL